MNELKTYSYIEDHPPKPADLVEVVRCKDCLIWDAEKYGYGWCKYNARTTHENWYCADGEREEEEDETNRR